jgi:hypothetical protein
MANPKMQEKKNKLLKNKKANKQKQKQNQKQSVTQTVNVHINKNAAPKRRPRSNPKREGYSAPIVNVSVPTMMRQVPFEVTNSHENEANLRRVREQQQNNYTQLLNQPTEHIPIAMPIIEHNYYIPPRVPNPPRNPPPPPPHFNLTPTTPHITKGSVALNEDWLNAFTNDIMKESLDKVKSEDKQRQENIKLWKEKENEDKKKKITKEFAKSFATGIVNESLQKMVTIKKDQEKMNAIEDKQEKEYELIIKKRHQENERDAWRGDPNRSEWWRVDEGVSEHKEAEDFTDSPTVVNNYMQPTQHSEKIKAEIEKVRALSPEELADACASANNKVYGLAARLGIKPTRNGKRRPAEEVREEIGILIGRRIITNKVGRPKTTTNINRLNNSPLK